MRTCTKSHDLFCDPMCGIGTTLVEASTGGPRPAVRGRRRSAPYPIMRSCP
ncbi:hypothetical protein [Streptomyces sp. NPDC018833]|uniref:hypothetical protein n=1 Tax=Streptomyces sp. NPDC018833 TaxID=3365053 RepID=UPI00378EC050